MVFSKVEQDKCNNTSIYISYHLSVFLLLPKDTSYFVHLG